MKLSSCALALFLASSASVTSSQNIRRQRKVGEIPDLSRFNRGLFHDEKKSESGSKSKSGSKTKAACPPLNKVELEPAACSYTVGGNEQFISIPNGLSCAGSPTRAALAVSGNNNIIDCHGGDILGPGGFSGGIGVEFSGTNNVIQNCNISGFFPGMKVESGATVLISNVSSNGNTQAGLLVKAGGAATIKDSKFQGNSGRGIQCEVYESSSSSGAATLAVTGDTVISDNTDSGILLVGLVAAYLHDINVSRNKRNVIIEKAGALTPAITMIDVKACDATSGEDIIDETIATIAGHEGVTCNNALDSFEREPIRALQGTESRALQGTEIECYCDKVCPT